MGMYIHWEKPILHNKVPQNSFHVTCYVVTQLPWLITKSSSKHVFSILLLPHAYLPLASIMEEKMCLRRPGYIPESVWGDQNETIVYAQVVKLHQSVSLAQARTRRSTHSSHFVFPLTLGIWPSTSLIRSSGASEGENCS